jgi:hypothetical protein
VGYRWVAVVVLLVLICPARAAEHADRDGVFSFSYGSNWQVTVDADGAVTADCVAGGCAHEGSCVFAKTKVEFGSKELFDEEVTTGLAQGQIEGFSQLGPTEQVEKYMPRRIGQNDGIFAEFRSRAPHGTVHFSAFATWHKGYLIQVICRGPERVWAKHVAPQVDRLVASLALRK